MIEHLVNYWPVYVGVSAVIAVAIFAVIRFCKLPTTAQKTKIKEWLLQAVTSAEKDLGTGTGQLKLSTVYAAFKQSFSFISVFMPFETFSALVDEALVTMRKLLKDNSNVATYVYGEDGKTESVTE